MTDAELLALHREMVAIPSLSGEEGPLAAFVVEFLAARNLAAQRFGNSVFAVAGRGPVVCLNSHLDTVPASPAWTRPPHQPAVEGGRVYGLGSNDAKGAAAAMTAAFLRLAGRADELGVRVLLALAAEEEVGSKGTERLVPELARRGLRPAAVVVGEPTDFEVATSQKGLLVLELVATGQACHAAHGCALGAPNALRTLARDLVALDGVDLGPDHPRLGPVTLEPTMARGGTARNMIPAEASCVLDVRTNPDLAPEELAARLQAAVSGELRVLSARLRPYEIAEDHPLVLAALAARPQARTFGSRGLSDLVFFTGIPGIKVGPGRSERSHTPDEFVLEDEVLEGARFYERLVLGCGSFLGEGEDGMTRLWDRNEPLDRLVLEFTAGEDHALDDRLVAYDVRASAAHAEMLCQAGFLSESDNAAVQRALLAIGAAHGRGEWRVALEEEDCHTALENRLTAAVGEAGRRIHLGRSRNDQVLAALRLWLKDELETLAGEAEAVAAALDAIARSRGELVMPGYTHMQRAMPTSLGGWTGAFAAELRDDAAGLLAARRRADLNPLGSAAGYGVPVLALDRSLTTRALGFSAAHEPVTAVQLSRGKAEAGALFEAALLAQDLGRLAADLCLFATAEFGFVKLPPALTTGSSMLPQKRNPDLFELVRGRTGEAVAALAELLAVTAKLPSGYHRDLQLIKKPLFRGLDSAGASARLLAHALPAVEFDEARMREAVDPSLLAAERAYRMVVELGLPFREAYRRARET